MIEFRWRFAKDSEPFAIITSGQRMVLQMRQKEPWTQNPRIKTWGEWEDLPVDGIENK